MTKFHLISLWLILLSSSITFAQNFSEQENSVNPETLRLAVKYPSLSQNFTNGLTFTTGFNSEIENQVMPKQKSKGRAFLYSLLLPGAGEHYLGKKNLARTFLITELVLWAGYFSFQTYSDWKRDDMYLMAATHADANVKGKPSQYFVNLENYNNIYEYNDAKQRQREFYDIYSVEDYYWSWDNEDNRKKFEQLRISSDLARNRSIFVIGGIIANHLVSAIDAVWHTYKHNKKVSEKLGIQIYFDARPYGELSMTIQKSF